MQITNYTDEGLETKIDPDTDGSCPSLFLTVKKTDDEIRQFCTWEQLEILRDQINDALGQRAERKHRELCETEAYKKRCAVCGFNLVEKPEDGCVRGNCSMRPRPERLFDEKRAIEEAEEARRENSDQAPHLKAGEHFAYPNGRAEAIN